MIESNGVPKMSNSILTYRFVAWSPYSVVMGAHACVMYTPSTTLASTPLHPTAHPLNKVLELHRNIIQ